MLFSLLLYALLTVKQKEFSISSTLKFDKRWMRSLSWAISYFFPSHSLCTEWKHLNRGGNVREWQLQTNATKVLSNDSVECVKLHFSSDLRSMEAVIKPNEGKCTIYLACLSCHKNLSQNNKIRPWNLH